MLTYLGIIPSSPTLLSHTFLIARRLIYISRIRGVIPKQAAFERLLFKKRELEKNSVLQLNELKKLHEKMERFQICRIDAQVCRCTLAPYKKRVKNCLPHSKNSLKPSSLFGDGSFDLVEVERKNLFTIIFY